MGVGFTISLLCLGVVREVLGSGALFGVDLFGPSFHIPHSQTVTFVDDDTATGVVTAHAELGMDDGSFWVALRYHDDYRREDGRWRFHRRVVHQLYAMPLRELVDDLAAAERVRWPDTPPRVAALPEGLPTWAAWVEDPAR